MTSFPGHTLTVVTQAEAAQSTGVLANPWFYAGISAIVITLGAAVGIWADPERRWQAIMLAVGGGSLIVSLAFELYQPAVEHLGRWIASGWFFGGVVTFGALDVALDRWADDETQENGIGLWASVTTDGIPENLAMGSVLTGNVGGAMAFLFALTVTNGSQSMLSGTNMSTNHGDWRTFGAWVCTGLVVGGAVLLGYFVVATFAHYWISVIEAFAGGAILASLAGEIYPDAYENAGPAITIATAIGFLVTFLL